MVRLSFLNLNSENCKGTFCSLPYYFLTLSLNSLLLIREGKVQMEKHRYIRISLTKASTLPIFQFFLSQNKADLGVTIFNKTGLRIRH